MNARLNGADFEEMTFEETLMAVGLKSREQVISLSEALVFLAKAWDHALTISAKSQFYPDNGDFLIIGKGADKEMVRVVRVAPYQYTIWANPDFDSIQ